MINFGNLQIVKVTRSLIEKSSNHRLPIDELVDEFAKLMPNENPHEQVRTLIAWGRFAEYLGYSDLSKEVYLDEGREPL